MASGHVNRTNRGRTHGRTDQYCTREKSPCQLGAVHTWPEATNFTLGTDVGSRSEAEVPFASEAQLCSGVMGLVVSGHLVD
jgi:hypothetical protein